MLDRCLVMYVPPDQVRARQLLLCISEGVFSLVPELVVGTISWSCVRANNHVDWKIVYGGKFIAIHLLMVYRGSVGWGEVKCVTWKFLYIKIEPGR